VPASQPSRRRPIRECIVHRLVHRPGPHVLACFEVFLPEERAKLDRTARTGALLGGRAVLPNSLSPSRSTDALMRAQDYNARSYCAVRFAIFTTPCRNFLYSANALTPCLAQGSRGKSCVPLLIGTVIAPTNPVPARLHRDRGVP